MTRPMPSGRAFAYASNLAQHQSPTFGHGYRSKSPRLMTTP